MSQDMRDALHERRDLIEARADDVLDTAIDDDAHWVKTLGPIPEGVRSAAAWRQRARVIAAYRDRYQVTVDAALGTTPESATQKIDRARVEVVKTAYDSLMDLGINNRICKQAVNDRTM